MSLQTPEAIRTLQRKLYSKAKAEPNFRFYLLYDKIWRADILRHAYGLARANKGAPGVDGVTFERIEAAGLEDWLTRLGGGERPLGIPTVQDRVVQTAAKLVLEPIFEADMDPAAYGYRPDAVRARSDPGGADAAATELHRCGRRRSEPVLRHHPTPRADALDCPSYCRSRHARLIKQWLKAPVETTDGGGRRRMEGGKASRQGTPQGGVISPLVANLYMNRFLKHWRQSGRGKAWQAHVINYADDFVILSRGHATEALAWTDRVMRRLGLSLNRTKTCVRDARQERFDFLGYSFGPHCFRQTGRWFIGTSSPDQVRDLRRACSV